MAEGRGKAQADTLRRMRSETEARRLNADGTESRVAAVELLKGDRVVCEAGDSSLLTGRSSRGFASVDESAITGESAPVIRESGATVPPSPVARKYFPTGSWSASRPSVGTPSSTG